MNIKHRFTVTIPKGRLTVLSIEKEGEAETRGITVLHAGPTNTVFEDSLEKIIEAVDRHRVLARNELMNAQIAEAIEENLITWLFAMHGVEFRCLRWDEDRMVGFATVKEGQEYDERRSGAAPLQEPRRRKIMLG